MTYASTYESDEYHGRGYENKDEYALVNSAGYYEFDPPNGLTYRKYGRADYYLSYNHSGDMLVKINRKEYEIGPGTVFIYSPYQEQFYEQVDNQLISNYWVHFTGFGIQELLLKANLEADQVYHVSVNEEIPHLINTIIDEISRKQVNFKHISSILLQQLFFTISRKYAHVNNINENSQIDSRIVETVDFIRKNYKNNITVPELADISGWSVSRYSYLFKQKFNVSPQQYLINYRLQKAKELMAFTNLTLYQIAEMTGFADQFHFSKTFKKYEKKTPMEYRM
ncbi:AraC family transcriptional regulator [Lederbergia panacisoli]|uniref:AraC family transcriptional regulator n=1 Tax=Lederbergia panacisoli TaxID=1255251 RepID=UPI00214B26B4|nr:AraC family transcriptional regulator [Lederbergia panacisoli]MCR2822976.1 AraC family transcriptional regulator [Lederbergia panacisoli]